MQGLQYISSLSKLRDLSLYNFNYPLLRSLSTFEHLKKLDIELSKFSSVVFPEVKSDSVLIVTHLDDFLECRNDINRSFYTTRDTATNHSLSESEAPNRRKNEC